MSWRAVPLSVIWKKIANFLKFLRYIRYPRALLGRHPPSVLGWATIPNNASRDNRFTRDEERQRQLAAHRDRNPKAASAKAERRAQEQAPRRVCVGFSRATTALHCDVRYAQGDEQSLISGFSSEWESETQRLLSTNFKETKIQRAMRTCARTFSTICLAACNKTRDTGMIKFEEWKFPSYERTKNRTSELYLIRIILCATKDNFDLFDVQTTLKNIARISYNFCIFGILKKFHKFVKIGKTSGNTLVFWSL